MPKPFNPICGHNADYACTSCGKCGACCEDFVKPPGTPPPLEHVDSKIIQERWRVLRIIARDQEARRG